MDCYVSLRVESLLIFKKSTFCFAGKQNCARESASGQEKRGPHVDFGSSNVSHQC